jgi:hypothetical protein
MPRFIYPAGTPSPPTRAKVECHVTLGNGKVVKSEPSYVPCMEGPLKPEITVDDLPDDRNWEGYEDG